MSDLLERARRAGDDDWNELFLENGADAFALAARLLDAAPSSDERALGLRMAGASLFEEERENPEALPWTVDADVPLAAIQALVAPLLRALRDDDAADGARALDGLFAAARHGADVGAAGDVVVPHFADKPEKGAKGAKGTKGAKERRSAAFAVRVHALCRHGKSADVVAHLKGNAPLKAVLFEELATPRPRARSPRAGAQRATTQRRSSRSP